MKNYIDMVIVKKQNDIFEVIALNDDFVGFSLGSFNSLENAYKIKCLYGFNEKKYIIDIDAFNVEEIYF